ncbi:neuronal acetylcholine receptor subunit alpha-10-like [Mya arenaria]|uniref:neuronal acetylcholine receptor subunit alpha-10-like n=1 Tax=Mya arenaria TaxID=6604 RepID=UPI0022DFC66C|nr:neuronal acetylcholine receptor subunit alpha-10-like [Mya arenaria]
MDCKVLAVLSCIGIVACSHPEAYTNRQQLYNDLMHKYEKNVLPNSGNGNGVNVTLDIMIRRIIGMNNHILTLDAFIPIHWRADNLKWKPDKVGGIKMIDMPSEIVWKPDLAYVEGEGKTVFIKSEGANVIISSDGRVFWDAPVQTKTFCKHGELHNGDEIDCHLTFYSWVHSSATLDLKLVADQMDTSSLDVAFNPHWKLVSTHAKVTNKTYRHCPGTYPLATFTLRLRYVA